MQTTKEVPKTRLDYNREIVQLLASYIEKYPDIRFGQALHNLGIAHAYKTVAYSISEDDDTPVDIFVDNFFEEPINTLKRIQNERD